jgi:hypothetical protein
MIDTRTQYIVYKERENELNTQIERLRAARERGACNETNPSWISAAEQWLKARVFSGRKSGHEPVSARAGC